MGGERGAAVWPYGIAEGTNIAELLNNWRDRDKPDRFLHLWELGKPVIAAVNGWCMGGGSWYALFSHMTYAADNAVFAQPEVRMMSNTSFIWILAAGFKNGLRYALTGDHIDAQEALRIALVSPDTVKINLHVATMGLEMMGLRNALVLNGELSAFAHASKREEFQSHLDAARKEGGLRGFLQARDGPFQPEPFGPRSRPREG